MTDGRSTRENVQLMQRVLRDHMKHDLEEADRQALRKAGNRFAQCALIGTLVGASAGLRLAFRGRYAFGNMRNLPKLFNESGKPNTEALRDRMVFGIKSSLYFSLGMLVGVQAGSMIGFPLAQRIIANEGNQERIARAMQAAQRDLTSSLRQRGLPESANKNEAPFEGEGSLASEWERNQPKTIDGDDLSQLNSSSRENDEKRSRWEELRNNSTLPSTWERIRQDTARKGSPANDQQAANPDRVLDNRQKTLEERQRDFDALMEKERRATNDGFVTEPSLK